jgi:hypothetical protein
MANFKPWEYADDAKATVRVAGGPTKNPKKMTGTRLGKVLGLDSWGTPFQAWCEMTRVAEPPFEGNKYTEAGNALEPKIIAWCKDAVSPYVYTPEEFYGVKDAKQHTGYDFFPKDPVLGGMWDAIILDGPLGKGKPLGYVEAKTSSRPQDWQDGPPQKYIVQALLYAFLDDLERVFIPVRFMEPHEYDNPSACECNDDNTFMYELKVSETQIDGKSIGDCVDEAMDWYLSHVSANVSPAFDEKKDKEYLAIMRKAEVSHKDEGGDLKEIAKKAAILEAKIEAITTKAGLAALEKELKGLKDTLKSGMIPMFTANDKVVSAYGWKVVKSVRTGIDKEALESDGLLEKYTVETATYTMSKEK